MALVTKAELEKFNTQRAGWYYCAEFGVFHGFKYLPATSDFREAWAGNLWGPFETFTEAKKDALGYFRTDIKYAQDALKEVRAAKKIGQEIETDGEEDEG